MFQTADMFKAFAPFRGNAVVIPGRGGRHWINLSDKPDRDVPLGDPAMGGHASFSFGLAMARPDEKIILFDSEGDILMNMGALTTRVSKPSILNGLERGHCFLMSPAWIFNMISAAMSFLVVNCLSSSNASRASSNVDR